jgi:hypothetical protein
MAEATLRRLRLPSTCMTVSNSTEGLTGLSITASTPAPKASMRMSSLLSAATSTQRGALQHLPAQLVGHRQAIEAGHLPVEKDQVEGLARRRCPG